MSLLFLLVVHQIAPCPVPPVHPLEELQQAVQRDRDAAGAIDRALTCRQTGGSDCASEVTQCTALLVANATAEKAFDEAPYLVDLETSYRGESFTPSRIWAPATLLNLARCPASLLALRDLLGRAGEQQTRRTALSREYVA